METEKLFDILELIGGGIRESQWKTVMVIVDYIKKDSVVIVDKKWNDKFRQENPEYYPLDLSKLDTWSTFDRTCIDLYFYKKGLDFMCDVKIYDGESFGGYRKGLRFDAKLNLPIKFIHEIENIVNYKFDNYLEDAYEKHLQKQKENWIGKKKKEILKLK